MNRKVWVMVSALLGVLLVIAVVSSQMTVSTVTAGAKGAMILQERLRTACGAVVVEEPPLKVYAVPPATPDAGWRWKVEATLREGKRPGDGDVDRALERVVSGCLTTSPAPGGKGPAGLLVRFKVPGGPDWSADYDSQGVRRLPEGPK